MRDCFNIPDSGKDDISLDELDFFKWLNENDIKEKRRDRKREFKYTRFKYIPDMRIIRIYLRTLGFVFRKDRLSKIDLDILKSCINYYNIY